MLKFASIQRVIGALVAWSSLMMLPPAAVGSLYRDGTMTLFLLSALFVGIFAYYAIVAAMRVGEVSFVTPFRYTRLLFALIIGIVIFRENPDWLTLLGAGIIVLSGIYTVWRERRLAQSPQ